MGKQFFLVSSRIASHISSRILSVLRKILFRAKRPLRPIPQSESADIFGALRQAAVYTKHDFRVVQRHGTQLRLILTLVAWCRTIKFCVFGP
jgi:hypothetical protein